MTAWRFFSIFVLVLVAACTTPEDRAGQDIRNFVRESHPDGVPYDRVAGFDPDTAVPILLDMLDDPAELEHWPNIVVTLGMIGDDRAVEPLILFAEHSPARSISDVEYVAKTGAILSLGPVVHVSDDERALDYLVQGLDPDVWSRRGVTWSSPFHMSPHHLHEELTAIAIIGLGFTGDSRARAALVAEADPARADVPGSLQNRIPGIDQALAEALAVNAVVAEQGLVGYYAAVQE